jgi:ubiquinone biosynthesis protein UbiJ
MPLEPFVTGVMETGLNTLLKESPDSKAALLRLKLEGDLNLAQQFSALLTELKPDVEEKLSQYTGDIVAHTLVSGVKNSACWVKTQISRQTRHAAEVLTEEWKIAPAPLEIAHFCDQVSDVDAQLAELDARLTRLLNRNSVESA